jgi:hypothetical protein
LQVQAKGNEKTSANLGEQALVISLNPGRQKYHIPDAQKLPDVVS